jgi:hypothetical protein
MQDWSASLRHLNGADYEGMEIIGNNTFTISGRSVDLSKMYLDELF